MYRDQIAKITGVSKRRIRLYEHLGLLDVEHDQQGRTLFTEAHIHVVKLITVALAAGFSLRALLALLHDLGGFQRSGIDRALQHLDAHMSSLHLSATQPSSANSISAVPPNQEDPASGNRQREHILYLKRELNKMRELG